MKKLLTLTLAILALAVFTGLSVAQGAQQKDKQKSPGRNVVIEREKAVTGTVMEVNENAQTFKVKTDKGEMLTLSFSKMKGDFTRAHFKVRDRVDVTYTDPTNPGDPPCATTVSSSKSNASEYARVPRTAILIGRVTNVDEKAQTFTVRTDKGEQFTFSFSAKEMPPPKKDEQVEVTYIRKTPGGPMEARAVRGSKSNNLRVASDAHSAQQITGKVLRVNAKDKTFTIMAKGKEVTLDGKELEALPEVGKIYDITYTGTPGGPMVAKAVKGSKSNSL